MGVSTVLSGSTGCQGFGRDGRGVGRIRCVSRQRRGGLAEQKFVTPTRSETRETFLIAANSETAIACEIARAIADRQSRQFDGQTRVGSVDRPKKRDAAPGVVGCDCLRYAAVRIEPEQSSDLAPQPAEARGGSRADQRVNSSDPNEKWPSASICHMKRSG